MKNLIKKLLDYILTDVPNVSQDDDLVLLWKEEEGLQGRVVLIGILSKVIRYNINKLLSE